MRAEFYKKQDHIDCVGVQIPLVIRTATYFPNGVHLFSEWRWRIHCFVNGLSRFFEWRRSHRVRGCSGNVPTFGFGITFLAIFLLHVV